MFRSATNLSIGLEAATHALLQGSLEVVQDVEELLNDGVQLLSSWKEEYVDLVQVSSTRMFMFPLPFSVFLFSVPVLLQLLASWKEEYVNLVQVTRRMLF